MIVLNRGVVVGVKPGAVWAAVKTGSFRVPRFPGFKRINAHEIKGKMTSSLIAARLPLQFTACSSLLAVSLYSLQLTPIVNHTRFFFYKNTKSKSQPGCS